MKPITVPDSQESLEKAAAVLKAIAHPVRLRIISILKNENELPVNEICQETGCEQSLASHHLNAMKIRGLIKSRRDGKQIFYSLKEQELIGLLACIQKCNCNFA